MSDVSSRRRDAEEEPAEEPHRGDHRSTTASENDDPVKHRRGGGGPRKGHTKSRNGCIGCKRRRVKCSERRPECEGCLRMGLVCEWAWPAKRHLGAGSGRRRVVTMGVGDSSSGDGEDEEREMVTVMVMGKGGSPPPVFGMEDLRFFQHFVLDAIPPLPVGGGEVWRGVARMAHEYDFLMHAVLALGASHLSLCSTLSDSSNSALSSSGTGVMERQALGHRVRAIRALNDKLSAGRLSRVDGDAAFAAMMALTFQAGYMVDGMGDFVAMVRGCHVVADNAMPSFPDSAFRGFSGPGYVSGFRSLLQPDNPSRHPRLEDVREAERREVLDGFVGSLRDVGALCGSVCEVEYLAGMKRVVGLAIAGSEDAYLEFAAMYNRLGEMSSDDFVRFSAAGNHAARILLGHFFLLAQVVEMINHRRGRSREGRFRARVTLAWLEGIEEGLPGELKGYLGWPLGFARGRMRRLDGGEGGFVGMGLS
ncbi:C6 transcription factor [Colletotrichum asianum]